MYPIQLICTDLDGTLLDESESQANLRRFSQLLTECAQRWGAQWAVVTGRRKVDVDPLLMHFLVYGLRPAFLVVEDGLIYQRNQRGNFAGFRWWNFNIQRKRTHLGRRSAADIVRWREELLEAFPEGADRSRQTVDLWLEFPDAEQTLRAELELLDKIRHTEDFQVFRWNRELFLAPTVGTKGEAVRKLMQKLSIPVGSIFAVGDGPNDLSMLDGSAAGKTACVNNALDRVKQVVERSRGYVAAGQKTEGVVEALEWYMHRAAGRL